MIKLIYTLFLTLLTFNVFADTEDFIVEYKEQSNLNYGQEISFQFYWKTKKGKKKELSDRSQDNITFTVKNGDFTFYNAPGSRDLLGKLILAPKPFSLADSIVTIDFVYTIKDKTYTRNFKFVLNFKGPFSVDFSGQKGGPGKTFKSVGAAILSNASHDGEPGLPGTPGTDLMCTMVMNIESDTFYVLNINNEKTGDYYIYKIKKDIPAIKIISNGGDGGKGGDGTDGTVNNRFRIDGGNGGKGGDGGNSGKITFYLDERGWKMLYKISLENNPGYGGEGGEPGDGKVHKDDSSLVGKRGNKGQTGNQGSNANLAVPELKKLE